MCQHKMKSIIISGDGAFEPCISRTTTTVTFSLVSVAAMRLASLATLYTQNDQHADHSIVYTLVCASAEQ